jgi:alkylated DNA repair dioxygenase AlkB
MISGRRMKVNEPEIQLITDFFDPEESDQLFASLKSDVDWRQEPILIYGKKVMQPRLTAWYGDANASYRYSGIEMKPLPWISSLALIRDRIRLQTGFEFNSVLLNQYRDGKDSMGWHRDNEPELGTDPVIASVSFGSSRRFLFRRYRQHDQKMELTLDHGSLLIMKGQTQMNWEHSIPKMMRVTDVRINLTFRLIQGLG